MEKTKTTDDSILDTGVKPIKIDLEQVNDLGKAAKLEVVKSNALSALYIQNPSVEMMIEAIKQNYVLFQYFEDRSDKFISAAIKTNPLVIKYLDTNKLSEDDQLGAVKRNPYTLRYIKNPSDAVKHTAVYSIGRTIRFIPEKEQTPELQKTAISLNKEELASNELEIRNFKFERHTALEYIINPTKEVLEIAIKQYPSDIGNIDPKLITPNLIISAINSNCMNISSVLIGLGVALNRKAQLLLVEHDPNGLKAIKDPSYEVKLTAVRAFPQAIRHIFMPDETLQYEAIKASNGTAIKYITNQSRGAKSLALELDGSLFKDVTGIDDLLLNIAIMSTPSIILSIRKPTKDQIKLAFEFDPKLAVFSTIIKSDDEDKLAAIKKDVNLLNLLKTATPEIKAYVKGLSSK